MYPNEQAYMDDISERIENLRSFLNEQSIPPQTDSMALFRYVEQMRTLLGNTANLQSFLAMLLAKDYLLEHFDLVNFDVAEKAQGAPGLDIDIKTRNGQRIVGELKTTIPHGEKDLGSAQRTSFRKDFKKLNLADADHKFFFVTHPRTYEYVMTKYVDEIPGVEVVLLTAPEQEA